MSLKAITWVFETTVGSPCDKSVLIAMADHTSESGKAFPSVSLLCRKTEYDRRTIMRSLARLEAAGFIKDTGQRVGATKKVKVWKLSWANEWAGQSETVTKTIPLQSGDSVTPNGDSGAPNGDSGAKRTLSNRQGTSPIVPKGDRSDTAAWADRIATIFHRRLDTPWSAKEIKVFRTLIPFNDDDLCMIERRYAGERLNKENTLRRDLCTFLNNYRGEVDRALAWCEKHPVRSHTLKAPISLHSEAPPPDPAATAAFLTQFKEKFGRLPYGHTENGQ